MNARIPPSGADWFSLSHRERVGVRGKRASDCTNALDGSSNRDQPNPLENFHAPPHTRSVHKPSHIPRLLRQKETWAEKWMWALLRNRRFSAYKFRRQHRFEDYILDFFCVEASLNIELDGGRHGFPQQRQADVQRDKWLEERGVKV